MAKSQYAYLKARGLCGVFSLWLGDGHLLQATAVLGVEFYRRFYLHEIQALIIRRTAMRAIWNLIWGVPCGLAFAAAGGLAGLAATSAKNDGQEPLYVFAGIVGSFAAACAGVMIWNSLLGPTCTLFLQTPGGLQPLSAPSRVRSANALLTRLRPLIEEAQLQNPISV